MSAKFNILREMVRRERARTSLHTFALSVDIPTVNFCAMQPDEDLLGPARNLMSRHHAAILDVTQRTMDRPFGRAIIMLPPGSAKSLYVDVIGTTWEMGRKPKSRIMLASYGSNIAERQARRAMQVVEQSLYRDIFPEAPTLDRSAAGDWSMSNGSEMLSMGLTAGLTGNRASGAIIDDPVAGREEADSETERQNILDAYTDDLKTRLLPGAWLILIMTRWHEADLAGSILPPDYKGESGLIKCTDGLVWEVLNLPAKCEHVDDPLGRKIGEYLWPEFYPPEHWHMFERAGGPEAQRVWSSLYQQRPSPVGSGRIDSSMIDFYKEGAQPPYLAYIGAGDYAVTSGGNDFTECGVFGVDPQGELWEVDWWNGQVDTGVSTERTIDMMEKWKLPMWFNEGGVIDKAMGPLINLRMRQRSVFCDRRTIPSMADKVAKCASFQGRCASGGETSPGSGEWKPGAVHFRDNSNSRRIVAQLVALPAGRYDDAADVCGLVGRAVDQFYHVHVPSPTARKILTPFSKEWLEYQEHEEQQTRYR